MRVSWNTRNNAHIISEFNNLLLLLFLINVTQFCYYIAWERSHYSARAGKSSRGGCVCLRKEVEEGHKRWTLAKVRCYYYIREFEYKRERTLYTLQKTHNCELTGEFSRDFVCVAAEKIEKYSSRFLQKRLKKFFYFRKKKNLFKKKI